MRPTSSVMPNTRRVEPRTSCQLRRSAATGAGALEHHDGSGEEPARVHEDHEHDDDGEHDDQHRRAARAERVHGARDDAEGDPEEQDAEAEEEHRHPDDRAEPLAHRAVRRPEAGRAGRGRCRRRRGSSPRWRSAAPRAPGAGRCRAPRRRAENSVDARLVSCSGVTVAAGAELLQPRGGAADPGELVHDVAEDRERQLDDGGDRQDEPHVAPVQGERRVEQLADRLGAEPPRPREDGRLGPSPPRWRRRRGPAIPAPGPIPGATPPAVRPTRRGCGQPPGGGGGGGGGGGLALICGYSAAPACARRYLCEP